MAAIANLTIDQGATFNSDVTVKDANGNAFDLTGYSASAKMAKGFQSTKTRTIRRGGFGAAARSVGTRFSTAGKFRRFGGFRSFGG